MRLKAVTGTLLTLLLIDMLALALSIDGRYVLAVGVWSISTVDSAGNVGWYSSIALDSGNKPHISYHDGNNGALKYAYHTYEAPPPPPEGVGGIKSPVDKFGLLAPYIGLASTIIVATAATGVYIKRLKRRKEK